MQIVLTGASGLIGTALKQSLRGDGHHVKTLVRHDTSEPDEDSWDPAHDRLDPDFVAGSDAVVCLSGVGVGDHRWTDDYKRQIVQSRVDSVGTMARSLAEYGGAPVLICASAVGYYGDTGDALVDEQTPAGSSFLADVCVQWEAAAEPANAAGVRVTHLRTGLVLAKHGGLLKRLTPLVRAGIAGKLGSGKQYMPWISLTDEIAAIRFLIEHDVAGPVNLTGPAPVRNADFTKTLGHVLRRPTVLPVPGFAAKIALGEFADDVLTGQNAVPKRLHEAGFTFAHNNLESALRAELGV
ncbi:MAG TPA: TIGR01777 family oxidoreductase [Jatrophihabitans sp.]|jgi:hypothetical protein|uniref:TIGR01777 family oxidoreductase n=1 Tax=Jatrophihabitans sp. TaxID=1932789 RepID=UPI002DFF7E40|nr:TIGR01777 family oxidoreductase [Jatrophihabitans sp.]